MIDPRRDAHATGLELQLSELVSRRERALHEGWPDEAAGFDRDIARLQEELAATAWDGPPAERLSG
ncbi:MAG: hypothetical protein ACYDAD_08020 [Acidimicrobiales bacterium]